MAVGVRVCGVPVRSLGQVCLLDLRKSPVPAGSTTQVDCITYRSRPTEPVPVEQLLVEHGQGEQPL